MCLKKSDIELVNSLKLWNMKDSKGEFIKFLKIIFLVFIGDRVVWDR